MVFDYSPAPVPGTAVDLRPVYGPFIGGEFRTSGGTAAVGNPATGAVLTEVVQADSADVDAAVDAASAALSGGWGSAPGRDRARHLYLLASLLAERSPELALLETLDSGTPIRQCRGTSLPLAAETCFYYAGWADKLRHARRQDAPDGAEPRPMGVVALLVADPVPLPTLIRKIAAALACGNAVILRPSETTPLTSLALAELAGDARLPAGVLNLVPGGDEVRDALLAHPGIAAVAQVGPTPASGIAAAALAGTGRRVRLDLPSTAVHLVFDDAPVDDAVEGIVQSAFAGAAFEPRRGSLLLVQESVAQDLLARIKRRMATLRVGDPLDQNTDVGPLPCASRLASARAGVAAVPEGETWSLECDLPERGFWFPPTLVTTAVPAAVGPVLAIRSFRTPAEALALANGTGHGVSAGVWTEKGSRALALADRLRADVVWVNTFNRYTPSTAFGWHGGADFGREGGTGGLEAYLAS